MAGLQARILAGVCGELVPAATAYCTPAKSQHRARSSTGILSADPQQCEAGTAATGTVQMKK